MIDKVSGQESDEFAVVRRALALTGGREADLWSIEHIDITCDGCELEPIVGLRSPPPLLTRYDNLPFHPP